MAGTHVRHSESWQAVRREGPESQVQGSKVDEWSFAADSM